MLLHCINNEKCKAVFKKSSAKMFFLLDPVCFNYFQCDLVDVRAPHAVQLARRHLPQGYQWRKTHLE